MLSTQDFAQRVLSSLEDLRERLAVLEAEVRHVREHLERLETHLHRHLKDDGRSPLEKGGRNGNGATVTIRLSRKVLSGGGLVGGGVVAVVAGVGRLLGWW